MRFLQVFSALVLIALAAVYSLRAQDDGTLPGPKPYKFVLGPELSGDDAKKAIVKSSFKAVADDRFEYEVYYNVKRSGAASDAGGAAGGFARSETWITQCNYTLEEDTLNGRKDLLAAFRFDNLYFELSDGDTSYSGYIGPAYGDGPQKTNATFWKAERDGSRSTAYQIPGWAGVNAGSVEGSRATQSSPNNAACWLSITETGKLYNEMYFAEFDSADQRNYPGRLLDPVQLMLAIQPEFAADASVQLGADIVVRRRMPMGALAGATVDYDMTYTLEKVYGTVAEPTAAQFKFSGKPVNANQTARVRGIDVSFTAPEITDGLLVIDLIKGVAGVVRWKYALKGQAGEPGGPRTATFGCEAEFSASLRKKK